MKKTLVLSAWLIFFSVTSVFGAQIVISVSDFKVESDELSHKYIGKGLSRLVAVELKKSRQVELLEREQIMKILEEQELSLSDLADDAKQVEIGQLLAAEYIIFGEVINMGTAVLLSLRMVNVTTGKIEWQEAITEKLESYDYIGAYFAKSILTQLGAGVEETIVEKIEKKEVKDVKAIVIISEGIDAYDKGDKEKAKKEFSAAKKIDPVNEVAKFYLAKLITSTPKFRVENEYYAPTYNPAYLGLLKEDSFYSWSGGGLTPPDADQWGGQTVEGYYFKEYPITMALGYALPLGQRLGLALEYNGGHFDRHIGTPGAPSFDFQGVDVGELHPYFLSNGASVSLGYLLLDQLSLGASLRFSYVSPGEGATSGSIDEEIKYGIAAGFVYL
ncbi:MAG: hypothetical protein GH155_04300, partial [Spirochaeta sp.]|nr:hypothetical protein [Spirochaeta sp.]